MQTTLALNNVFSLNIPVKTVKEYCKHAGSEVNFWKTQCIHLGSLKDKLTIVGGINTTEDALKCLSIHM